ncbi:MAG: nucleoside kinase [Candidatus Neomarinimicrobiota bacterium]
MPRGHYKPYLVIRNDIFTSYNEIIKEPAKISLLRHFHESSHRAYENAAILILNYVVENLYPDQRLLVMHSMCDGVFCRFENEDFCTPSVIQQITAAFRKVVGENLAIEPLLVSRSDARRYFIEIGQADTVELLKYCESNFVTLYHVNGRRHWTLSPPAPTTGLIKVFDIKPYHKGFVLRCPTEGNDLRLRPFTDQERLYEIFHETDDWGRILNISTVADVNRLIVENQISDIIKIADALQEKKIANIADQIARDGSRRFVFVAGPSSSGKTTFAKRLSIQLRVLGFKTLLLSLDNYFCDRAELIERQGAHLNFEVLDAIDLELLNNHLQLLLKGEAVMPPVYDFHTGMKTEGQQSVRVDAGTVIIFEGIHGINPGLTQAIDDRYKFKIYVSALTHLNFDDMNRMHTHDTRLLRRIVRDNKYRGYGAAETIGMWKKVVEGEKKYIFTFQGNADVMFNSSLVYEHGVLKTPAATVLKNVPEEHHSYPEAQRLLDLLSYFIPVDDKEIPPTSIMREFIGNSSFSY